MFLHIMAMIRSGENGMVIYIFPHKVPYSGFGQKKGKENVKGKKNMIMYRRTSNFCFVTISVKCFGRKNGIFFFSQEEHQMEETGLFL